MKSSYLASQVVGLIIGLLFATSAMAQQIYVEAPGTRVTDSFYENMGVSFGFSLPGGQGNGSRVVGLLPDGRLNPLGNIIFSQNGSASAIPPFGGYDPNANANFGYGILTPGGGGYTLGIQFGSGSTRSVSSVTPGIMVQNGFGGSIGSGAFRPFVTGVVPVVGDDDSYYPPLMDNGVTRAINSGQLDLGSLGKNTQHVDRAASSAEDSAAVSTAEQSAPSVQTLKAARAERMAQRESELEQLLSDVDNLENEGDYPAARSCLRQAIKLCQDPRQKKGLRAHLTSLRGK